MILETTHYEKEHKELIDDLVGKPFSFWQSLRKNGIGSSRMIVEALSPNMDHILNKTSDINYANIELRPAGILIHITKGLRNYTWAVPYYHLVVYKTGGTSLHAQGKFIRFKRDKMFRNNKPFFAKMMVDKNIYDQQYNFTEEAWV